MSPFRATPGPIAFRVETISNPAETGPVFVEMANAGQNLLFNSLGFYVSTVWPAPLSVWCIAYPFRLPDFVLHRIAGPLSNGLALPLGDRHHNIEDQPTGCRPGV